MCLACGRHTAVEAIHRVWRYIAYDDVQVVPVLNFCIDADKLLLFSINVRILQHDMTEFWDGLLPNFVHLLPAGTVHRERAVYSSTFLL